MAWPGALPKLIKRWGCHEHGWFKHESGNTYTLTRNNGGPDLAFTGLNGEAGSPVVVRNHIQPADTRTASEVAADDAAHRDWQDYELLYLHDGGIMGGSIGAGTGLHNGWILCDDAGNPWVCRMYYSWDDTAQELTVDLYLRERFGVIGKATSDINLLISSYVIPAADMTDNQWTSAVLPSGPTGHRISPSEDGRDLLVNLYAVDAHLHCVAQFEISGSADLVTGAGLNVAASTYKTALNVEPVENETITLNGPETEYHQHTRYEHQCETYLPETPCAPTVTYTRHRVGTNSRPCGYTHTATGIAEWTTECSWNNYGESVGYWTITTDQNGDCHASFDYCTGSQHIQRTMTISCNGGSAQVTEDYMPLPGGVDVPGGRRSFFSFNELPNVGFVFIPDGPESGARAVLSVDGVAATDNDSKWHPVRAEWSPPGENGLWI